MIYSGNLGKGMLWQTYYVGYIEEQKAKSGKSDQS